jgi:hypothetical protein
VRSKTEIQLVVRDPATAGETISFWSSKNMGSKADPISCAAMRDQQLKYLCGDHGQSSSTASRGRIHTVAYVLGLACALLSSGCATFNGAGKSVLDQYGDVPDGHTADAAPLAPSSSGGQAKIPSLHELLTHGLEGSPSIEAKRNAYMSREIIEIDEQYDAFVRNMYQNRTRSDLATTMLNLFFGIAGTLTNSTGVQKNYAAASALVTGANVAVDKNVFLDKTVSAIISSMEAQRGRALVRLRTGMTKTINEYPPVAVQADLYAYQRAGTMIGGLSFIEDVAKQDVKNTQAVVDALPLLTTQEMADKYCLARSLLDRDHVDSMSVDKIRTAVAVVATDADRPADTKQAMIDYLKQKKAKKENIGAVYSAMKKAGILMDPCPKDK